MTSQTSSIFKKEETFYETLFIPPHKPSIHRLIDCNIVPEIVEYKAFHTVQGLSYEGQQLTGLTLSLMLKLNQKITYIANTPEQTLHAIHYAHFKSSHINLPPVHHDQDTCSLVESGLIIITPKISSVKNFILNNKSFEQCALLTLKIELP